LCGPGLSPVYPRGSPSHNRSITALLPLCLTRLAAYFLEGFDKSSCTGRNDSHVSTRQQASKRLPRHTANPTDSAITLTSFTAVTAKASYHLLETRAWCPKPAYARHEATGIPNQFNLDNTGRCLKLQKQTWSNQMGSKLTICFDLARTRTRSAWIPLGITA
jgi:hypothetical protein